jgi:uncharacterized damage-inducible protein DinB
MGRGRDSHAEREFDTEEWAGAKVRGPKNDRENPMRDRDYLVLMAEYNAFMNEKVYALCAPLSDEERKRDRGAFFKSIHGTLNHVLWGDRAWLIRLLRWDEPIGKPADMLFEDFDALRAERVRYDQLILAWARNLPEGGLSEPFEITSVVYKKTRRMPMYLVAVQMFNHQTHHRGQLTTLLTQLNIDPGVTDVPWFPFAAALTEDVV